MLSTATLLLADARLPTGAHTQSAGLEAAVQAGLGVGEVGDYIAHRLRTSASVDVGTALATMRALDNGEDLATIDAHWAARTPSHVQRAASVAAGQGYLRILRTHWPHSAALNMGEPPRPMAMAAVAQAMQLAPRELACVIIYDEIASMTSAALKLLPLDPMMTVSWTLQAQPLADDIIESALGWRTLDDIPAPGAPLLEEWALVHHHSNRRLFRA